MKTEAKHPWHKLGLSVVVLLFLLACSAEQVPSRATNQRASPNLRPLGSEPTAIIDNGTVQLGVWAEGHLNVPGGEPSLGGTAVVGLRYLPTGAEGTAPGCLCEGWGAGDVTSGESGHASEDSGISNIVPISMTATATTAVAVTEIGSILRVTHDYHPSTSPNLYEVTVTLENISSATVDPRYRRAMDWDVEPTAFREFVTIQGTPANLRFSSDNGFAVPNPFAGESSILFAGEAEDSGPYDHGALFDFGFDPLAPGERLSFNIYYGAAGSEADADAALGQVGAELYSYGQPNTANGPTLGTPNTFIFAFAEVGGPPIFNTPPVAADQNVTTAQDTPVDITLAATDANGDELTYSVVTTSEHGTLSGTAPNLTYTPDAGYVGGDSFTFRANDGEDDSNIATVSIEVTRSAENLPPTATSRSVTTAQDTPVAITLSGNDPEGAELNYTVETSPANGTLTGTAPDLTYTPGTGFSGSDAFTFTVSDGTHTSAPATVSITVTRADPPPTPKQFTIDFTGLRVGQTIWTVKRGKGLQGASGTERVSIYAKRFDNRGRLHNGNRAMIFDAECRGSAWRCSGGDKDLFNPGQGNVMIISQNGNSRNPNDNHWGGQMDFKFGHSFPSGVTVKSLRVMDVDHGATVYLYRGTQFLARINVPRVASGGAVTVPVDVSGVTFMRVGTRNSIAVDDIVFEATN